RACAPDRSLHQLRLHSLARLSLRVSFFFTYPPSPSIYTLSLHDALPIFVGYPRFPAPVEFIAAVIAYYVHPVNIQTACLIMEGAEFTENIINGVERPVKAAELFAFTLRVRAR